MAYVQDAAALFCLCNICNIIFRWTYSSRWRRGYSAGTARDSGWKYVESTLFGDILNKKSACEDSVRLVKSFVSGGSGAAMRNGSEFGLSIDVGHQRGWWCYGKLKIKSWGIYTLWWSSQWIAAACYVTTWSGCPDFCHHHHQIEELELAKLGGVTKIRKLFWPIILNWTSNSRRHQVSSRF